MNLDSLSFALSDISYSIANLTKKNYKTSVQEITRLVAQHGLEAERHLLRCLFSHVDFSGDGKSSGKDFHQTQYLIQECATLISKPNFISVFCYAIDNPLHHQKSLKPSSQLLSQLSKVLKLNRIQEVVFGIALLYSSNSELRLYAIQFVKQKLPDLLRSYIDSDSGPIQEGGLNDCPPEVLHFLLTHLLQGPKDQFGIGIEQKEAFLNTLRKDFPRDRVPVVLAPVLYQYKLDTIMDTLGSDSSSMCKSVEGSLSELIREIGYGFTASIEECRNALIHLGFRDLSPAGIAHILAAMASSHTGLNDSAPIQSMNTGNGSLWNDNKEKPEAGQITTWNIDVFIQVLHEMNPSLDWKEVIYELDHPGFILKDKQGFKLLWQALMHGLGCNSFPVDHLFRQWRNAEGQLSLFQQILTNYDMVSLTTFNCRLINTEVLKAPPEDDSPAIGNWKCLDLVGTLLYLSESGYYSQVQEIFKFPMQHCPDLLVLGLIQLQGPLIMLRQELLTSLMPIFLGNHPNGAAVIHYAWNYQAHANFIRPIIMHAMAEWYLRGDHDQTKLSRILDVAQDLKALSVLLNGSSFPFVIDLACLASRREYLKLDKWLTDKIREHGENFVKECVAFLKRRCPQILGGMVKEETLPKSAQLPPETLATMLACLQTCAGNVAQELSETILTMVGNCSILLNKPRQPPPGVVKTARGLEPAFSSSAINTPTNSLEALSSLGATVAGLSLGSSGNSGNNAAPIFPLSGSLNSFPNATSGSPAKLLSTPVPSTPAVSSVTQNPFSSIMPPLSSQLPGQFGTQLGLNTSTVMSSGISSVTTKAMLGQQNVDRLRQGDMSGIFPDMTQQVSKEIEDEANGYFQRIYNHPPHPTLSIDEVLEMLKRFQESPVKREREVFSCMIRNLFEEYRFFPQYPDKELLITAQLFGGIIEQGLVTYMALGLALRYVLDALKKPHNSKMYYFGITALDRFKNRLKEYSQYCQHLATIPHFQEFPTHLIEYVEYGARSQEPPSRPQGPVLPQITTGFSTVVSTAGRTVTSTTSTVTTTVAKPSTITGKPSIANATNIDTLLVATEKDEKIAPPESVQDKVAFIINNLAQVNLNQKTEEFKELVKEEYYPWVSQYLVMKRASIEANFHTLYSNFLDTIKTPDLTKLVIKETFRNIKVLLRSDKGIANFSDRSLLKNLGHWLGMLTLAKNKPILQIDIDIKALLIEAYHKGQQELLYVVPFVAKVLESCAKSKVFRPPNPWTMGIMGVLAELHQEQELKLNLKFEIEVLCKTLNLDINELKPSIILKDFDRANRIDPQLSPLSKQKENNSVREIQQVQTVSNTTPSALSAVVSTGTSEETINSVVGATSGNTPTPSGAGNTSTPVPTSIPQPQFAYHEINVTLNTLAQHIRINEQIALFQAHPHLKQFIKPAVERAIQDWIPPVVERSIKISLTTCEQIVKKDFALDPEEQRMRIAAHHMVKNLTAGMAMITCRDPLLISITANLRSAFTNAIQRLQNPQQKEITEQAVSLVAQENVELACCFIQKTAVEKAIPEIDKRLSAEYEVRKHARGEGRRYCDPLVLTYQAERMPEQIRLKVGGVTSQQMAVYEEFARNVPGFLPNNCERESSTSSSSSSFITKPVPVLQSYPTDDVTQIYDKVSSELDNYVHSIIAPANNPQAIALHSLMEAIFMARNSRDVLPALSLLRKAVEGLLEGLTQSLSTDPELTIRFREGHLLVLKALADPRVYGIQWTSKQVTRCLIECREDFRYNLDAFDCLVRSHLVNLQAYDLYLAQSMENGLNYMATAFAISLVKMYLIDDRQNGCVTDADFFNTIEMLMHIANHSRQPPDGLTQMLEVLRSLSDQSFPERITGGPMSMMHSGITQAREFDDPPGLHEKTEFLLREWVNMFHSPTAGRDSTKAFTLFVHQMNLQGILKNDDLITRFFRLSTEMCVDLCYRALADQPSSSPTLIRAKCFHTLDAYVRLIALLVKHSGDASNTVTKVNLLNKVLGIVAGVLLQDHEIRSTDFQQLPYHRIFIMLFLELSAPEPILEAINFQVTTAFCNTLHVLRPAKAPGFAYAWLELVSHRVFLGRMLALTPQQKAWNLYSQLLVHLFKFLAPFLRNVELAKPIHLLYKGTLRVLLVLLHDFPEFLCECHYSFCDVIPPNCIQMRNLILSAFPRNMRLPDPFTPNLKVDMLPEITAAPRLLTNFPNLILPPNFKKDLDSYIKTRSPVTFLSELRSSLQLSNEPGLRYNIPLINALVLYVGTQAITYIQSKGLTPSMSTITHSSHMDIFQNLAVDLDTEGRYLFLNAIANQLRYPNSHTHYFSCTLLYLFAEANTEAIQEQITRVLLERLIVNRPHPWGLLVTFIELIKNPTFKFWNHEFVRCAPEIEKLFESVARSCMQQKPSTESASS